MDCGTRSVRVLVRGDGVVAEEPSVVAVTASDPRHALVGRAALQLAARPPGDRGASAVRLVWPIDGPRLGEEAALEALLRHAAAQGAGPPRLFRPDLVVTVASDCAGDDRRRLLAAAARTGSRTAHLLDAPLAAALGAGLPTDTPLGALVVHAGAVETEVAVITHEGTIARETVPVGGIRLDRLLAARVLEVCGLAVDATEAERLKCALPAGPAGDRAADLVATATVPDADQPAATARLAAADLWPALLPALEAIADALARVIESLPARLQPGHRRRGAVLTGGTARLAGLPAWLGQRCGLPAAVAPDPERCPVLGTGRALDRLDAAGRQLLYMR